MGRRPAVMLSQAIEDYIGPGSIRWVEMTPATIRRNRMHLTLFMKAVTLGVPSEVKDIQVTSIGTAHIQRWQEVIKTHAMNTKNGEISTVKNFFGWLVQSGRWDNTGLPTSHLKTKRAKDVMPKARIREENWARLFGLTKNPRDLWLMQLGLYSGGRGQSEFTLLTVGDWWDMLASGEAVIRYRSPKTRGNEVIEVPIMGELVEAGEVFMSWYQKQMWAQGMQLERHHKLVPCLTRPYYGQDQSMAHRVIPDRSPTELRKIVTQVLTDDGRNIKGEGLHTLRRSAAYSMWMELERKRERQELQPGEIPIRMVMMFLNHSTEQQTWEYIGATPDREALKRVVTANRRFYSSTPAEVAKLRSIG